MKRDARGEVRLNVVYPQPPERVWRALTDRRALAKWLMPNDFEPRLGHRFRFTPHNRQDGSGAIQCEVIEMDAPRRLAYTWRAPSDDAPTLVTWTLEPTEDGTRVCLEHIGPEGDAIATDAIATDDATAAGDAWEDRTGRLQAMLSTGISRKYRLRRVADGRDRLIRKPRQIGRIAVTGVISSVSKRTNRTTAAKAG